MQLRITTDIGETKGVFTAYDEQNVMAGELTLSRAGEHLLIADHTGVVDNFSGKGVGKALVQELIAYAKKENVKVMPLCPFIKAYFDKHPEDVADILSK